MSSSALGAQVAHLAGQVRRARSTSRSLVRVDVDALEAVLERLDEQQAAPVTFHVPTFADPDDALTPPAPVRQRIEGTWLVEEADGCTCNGGTPEAGGAHEPGCGLEPVVDLSTLPGWDALTDTATVAPDGLWQGPTPRDGTPGPATLARLADPAAPSCPGPRLAAALREERESIADAAAPGCRDCGGTGVRVLLGTLYDESRPCWCVADRRRP